MQLSDLAIQLDSVAEKLKTKKPGLLHDIANSASRALGQRLDSGISPDIAESTRRERKANQSAPPLEDTMALYDAVVAVQQGVPYSDFDVNEYDGTLTIGVSGRDDLLAHQYGDNDEPAREIIPEEDIFWDGIVDHRLERYLEDVGL